MATEKNIIRSVRWSKSEWKYIVKQSKKAGISPSRYVREVALGERGISGELQGKEYRLKEISSQLKRISNNVNQVTRKAHETDHINEHRFNQAYRDIGRLGMKIIQELNDS